MLFNNNLKVPRILDDQKHPSKYVKITFDNDELLSLLKKLSKGRGLKCNKIVLVGGIPVTWKFYYVIKIYPLILDRPSEALFRTIKQNIQGTHLGDTATSSKRIRLFLETIFWSEFEDHLRFNNDRNINHKDLLTKRIHKQLAYTLLEELEHCFQRELSLKYILHVKRSRLLFFIYASIIINSVNYFFFKSHLISLLMVGAVLGIIFTLVYEFILPKRPGYYEDWYASDLQEQDAWEVATDRENIKLAMKVFKTEITLSEKKLESIVSAYRSYRSKEIKRHSFRCPHCHTTIGLGDLIIPHN